MNIAEMLQRRQQGMLSSTPPVAMPNAAIPFGASRQQLTPQQLEMLMKMLGNSQPTPFNPILSSGTRG